MNQFAERKGDHKDRPYGGDGGSPVQQCPNCKETIPETAAAECPHCGMPLGQAPPLSSGKKKCDFSKISGLRLSIISVALVVVFLIARDAPFLHPTRGLIVFSLAVIIPILGIIAFISSVYELIKLRKSDKKPVGRGSAILGLILSILIIIFCVPLPYLIITIGRERHVDPACKNNLKQFSLVLNMYADENNDKFPPIDDRKNNFVVDASLIFPEYLSGLSIFVCPHDRGRNVDEAFSLRDEKSSPGEMHPDCVTDRSYCYLGWQVTTDEEAEAFFEIYDKLSPEEYINDIEVPDKKSIDKPVILKKLSSGIDRFVIKDINEVFRGEENWGEMIPVMWDRPYTDPAKFSHRDCKTGEVGGYVLYTNGFIEFIKYGEKFPMTETMARLLEERPCEPIPDCEE